MYYVGFTSCLAEYFAGCAVLPTLARHELQTTSAAILQVHVTDATLRFMLHALGCQGTCKALCVCGDVREGDLGPLCMTKLTAAACWSRMAVA